MKPQALAPQTGRLIEAISRLECIKPFVLVGGTALSIQLKTRQSEDLDFMRWKEGKEECNKRRSMVMAAIALSAKTITKGE